MHLLLNPGDCYITVVLENKLQLNCQSCIASVQQKINDDQKYIASIPKLHVYVCIICVIDIFKQAVGPSVLQTFSTCAGKIIK